MSKDEQKKLLQELKTTRYGQALQYWLKDQLETVGDIKTCLSWEETLGRKYALKLLSDLFAVMEDKKVEQRGKNLYV